MTSDPEKKKEIQTQAFACRRTFNEIRVDDPALALKIVKGVRYATALNLWVAYGGTKAELDQVLGRES